MVIGDESEDAGDGLYAIGDSAGVKCGCGGGAETQIPAPVEEARNATLRCSPRHGGSAKDQSGGAPLPPRLAGWRIGGKQEKLAHTTAESAAAPCSVFVRAINRMSIGI